MRSMKKSFGTVLAVGALVAGMAAPSYGAFSATAPPSPWYQSGWNQSRTGDNPQETALTAANVAHLHQVWSVAVPGDGLTLTSVDSANGSAFFQGGADDRVHAVNTVTGAAAWNLSAPGCSEILSPPAIHLGVLVVSSQACRSGASYLSGYDVATGRRLWARRPQFSQAVADHSRTAAYTPKRLLRTADKVQISALDVKTGRCAVERHPRSGLRDRLLPARGRRDPPVPVQPDVHPGSDPSSGAVDWIRKVAGGQQILVSSGHVVVAGIGVVTAFSPSGTKQWQSRPAFNFMSATPTQLVISRLPGTVEGLALTSGVAMWSTTVSDAESTFGQPAIAGGVVYVGMDTDHGAAVYALRAGTGAQLWTGTFGTDDAPLVSVAAGTLFVSTNGTGSPPCGREAVS